MNSGLNEQLYEDALRKISTLASQIPGSTSFASASLAYQILDYARQIQRARAPDGPRWQPTPSSQSSPAPGSSSP
jgi:hypothetical protein